MKEDKNIRVDYDTHWKNIISNLFEDFIKFFLPKAHKLIDFQASVEFLEQELHKLVADKEKKGKVINDKLVKVKLKDGSEKWILIHIEIQSSFDTDFSERMFTYFYRIYDKYDQKITAIAIFTGSKNPKSYNKFGYDFWGTKVNYEFNSVKIGSYIDKELLESENPFAIAVLASKYLSKSKGDDSKKYSYKLKLIRIAKEKQLTDNQIINLLRFIDLILILPKDLESKFENEIIEKYIKSENMEPTKSQIKFANRIHLALYGETIEEKAKREERDKAILEKTLIIKRIIGETDWSDKKISEIFNVPVNFVKEMRKKN